MIPAEAVEAAMLALSAELGYQDDDWEPEVRVVLEAAAPHMLARAEIQVEVLIHARTVITQWLSTAEKWRYDQVCADFQEMIDTAAAGELNRPAA